MDAPRHDRLLRPSAVRMFGRLQLLRLLGKSERTMAWRVVDPRTGDERVLVLPRVQPAGAAAMQRWQQAVQRASRLNHPHLAAVVESGVQDDWPYVAYDANGTVTLTERLGNQGLASAEAVALAVPALRGLAFAHEAGAPHHDLQPYSLLIADDGDVRVAGVGVACEPGAADTGAHAGRDLGTLQAQRDAAERDVLSLGVLLHTMLAGPGAHGEADVGRVIARLAPPGRDIVRLPWTTPQPVADALRAIVNRATDRQPRQRYRGARTLLRALEGWLQAEGEQGGGPLALLADKLRLAGVLPSQAGASARVARLATMESEHSGELAQVVLEDVALAFEMLRLVNAAQVRAGQVGGGTPVLTVRRAIALLGMEGVRRAAMALRPWPGPLDAPAAAELDHQMARCAHAGRVAVALRPAAYDAEVVHLVAMLQNLGRLVVRYHFPDEAAQIGRLMQPAPPSRAGEPEEPGMSEEGAAYAVLGADLDAIGSAVVASWGLADGTLAMMRRVAVATPVRTPESDDEQLRVVASCANEAVDALALPPAKLLPALQRVVSRYARVLDITLRDLQAALLGTPAPPEADAPPDHAPPRPAAGLRATASQRAAQ